MSNWIHFLFQSIQHSRIFIQHQTVFGDWFWMDTDLESGASVRANVHYSFGNAQPTFVITSRAKCDVVQFESRQKLFTATKWFKTQTPNISIDQMLQMLILLVLTNLIFHRHHKTNRSKTLEIKPIDHFHSHEKWINLFDFICSGANKVFTRKKNL